jgi:hypothetical protein
VGKERPSSVAAAGPGPGGDDLKVELAQPDADRRRPQKLPRAMQPCVTPVASALPQPQVVGRCRVMLVLSTTTEPLWCPASACSFWPSNVNLLIWLLVFLISEI